MKKILYLHGFKSSPQKSLTLFKLKKAYAFKYDFIAPQLSGDPCVSIPLINNIIKENKPSLIIGSSLGGFYGLMCDSGDVPLILVNPCVNPYEHLQRYLGNEMDRETLEHYKEYDNIEEKTKSKIDNLLVLLSDNDEVLGNSHYEFFKKIKEETNYKYKLYDVGYNFGHRLYPYGISQLRQIIDENMYGC